MEMETGDGFMEAKPRQCLLPSKFQKIYKISRHIKSLTHETLNIGKKITNCIVCL